MRRVPESTGRKVARFAFIALLLPVIVPLAIVGLILHFLNKVVVYMLVWVWWLPKGKDVLYVSSDSPVWKEYMETEVFPLVAERAMVLSWSARSKWPKWSFGVRVFHTFGRSLDRRHVLDESGGRYLAVAGRSRACSLHTSISLFEPRQSGPCRQAMASTACAARWCWPGPNPRW